MSKKIKAQITICRDNWNRICIQLTDVTSGLRFVEAHMAVQAFGFAVTGLGFQAITVEIDDFPNLGKKRIWEKRRRRCELDTCEKKKMSEWLEKNAQEDGWTLNSYLGSLDSVEYEGNGMFLNYTVEKYVEIEEVEDEQSRRNGIVGTQED